MVSDRSRVDDGAVLESPVISDSHRQMLLDAGVPLLIMETLNVASKHRHLLLRQVAIEEALRGYWLRQLTWTLDNVLKPLRIQMLPREAKGTDGDKSGPTSGMTLDEALARLAQYPDDPVAAAVVDAQVEQSLIAGAEQTIRDMDAIGISFDLKNQAALDYLQANAWDRFGKDVDATTAKQLGAIITQGFEDGWNYAEIADAITAKFESFTATNPLLHIRNRAELISVTELGDAYSEGTIQAAYQLDDAGYEIEKMWLATDGCAQICQPNEDAGWVSLDTAFPSGHARPTGHPGCRCTVLTRRARVALAA